MSVEEVKYSQTLPIPCKCNRIYACPTDNCSCAIWNNDSECIPPGYQKKQYNPGNYVFYSYYYPKEISDRLLNSGRGWRYYNKTGVYHFY